MILAGDLYEDDRDLMNPFGGVDLAGKYSRRLRSDVSGNLLFDSKGGEYTTRFAIRK